MTRVLVVDDQPLFCAGIARILDAESDLECVGIAHNGEDAVAATEQLRPDVVLMDLRMPNTNGIEATRRISTSSPTTRVLVLTTFRDRSAVREATAAGALGFLTKDASPELLCKAVRTVAAGSAVFATGRAPMLPDTTSSPDLTAIASLTAREQTIYLHLARGLTNADVARRVHLSDNTVRTHVSAILRKLALANRAQVIHHAHEHGLLTSSTRNARPTISKSTAIKERVDPSSRDDPEP